MLLAVDTSTQWIGLALYDGAQVLAELIWQTKNHHTVELAPAVDDLLKRSGQTPDKLQALAVALGPGSFTSLRIGLAIVKGMSFALHIPVIGLPSMDILASSQPVRELPLITVLQAGRSRLAVSHYSAERGAWKPQGEIQVMNVDELAESIETPTVVVGELSAQERQVLTKYRRRAVLASPAQSLRRPSYLAELAWRRFKANKVSDVVALSPIYLHTVEGIPGA